ncbi:MAG: VCBS repeat-containing protein, partial [Bacteroidota bacterium]
MNQRQSLLFALILSAPTSLFAQEICNNGIDDDGDGFVDCYDSSCSGSAACADSYIGGSGNGITPHTTDFAMQELWNSSDTGAPTIYGSNHTVVGDIDGDGIPEILGVRRNKNGNTNYDGDDALYVFNGDDGSLKDSVRLGGATTLYMALADLEGDGCPEIFLGRRDDNLGQFRLVALNCDLTVKWESDTIPGTTNLLESVGILGVADFDQDSSPEVYAKGKIFDVQTGALKVNTTSSIGTIHKQQNAGAVAVDILDDNACDLCSGLELVIGEEVYAVDVIQGSFSLERTLASYNAGNRFITSSQGNNIHFTSIADLDQDGDLDLFVGGRVRPGEYPLAPKSVILENVSENGTAKFRQANDEIS